MLPSRDSCPYVLYCRMVTYVTTRRPGRRWQARIRSNSTFAFATQQKRPVGFWCQLKERLNREVGDVSRASLRLGRRAAGVGNSRTWQSCWQSCPKHCVRGAGRTDCRTRSRTYSCACAAADADARKPHVREAAWQLRPEQHYADKKHAQEEDP